MYGLASTYCVPHNMPYLLFMDNYPVNSTDSISKSYRLTWLHEFIAQFILLLLVKQNVESRNIL